MVNRGLVGCIAPHISEDGVGVIIKVEFFNVFLFLLYFFILIFFFVHLLPVYLLQAVCTVAESIVLGSISFMIYKDEGTYL